MAKTKSWLIPLILVLVAVPAFIGHYYQHILTMVMIWIALASAWDIVGGKTGQVSFGHAIFFGLGAYGGGLLYLHWNLSPWWGMIVGPLLATAIAIPIGLICFRLRGPYFALATLAFNEIVAGIFINLYSQTGGATGIDFPRTFGANDLPYYYIAFAIAALTIFVVYRLMNSKFGYYFVSIREDPDAAETLGIPTTRYKMYALIPSAALTGLVGAVYGNYIASMYPSSVFALEAISIFIILAALIGGVGTLWGPVLGGAIFAALNEGLRATIGLHSFLVFTIIAVLMIMFMPDGIMGAVEARRRRASAKMEVITNGAARG